MLNEQQEKWCEESQWDFSDLKALFLNCTLKRSPEISHTQGLIDISKAIMEKNGIAGPTGEIDLMLLRFAPCLVP